MKAVAVLVLAGYVAFAALVLAFGQAPAFVLARVWEGSWGSAYGAAQVLYKATPILFCAASFEVTRRAGFFNIGAEGQLAVASLVVAMLGTRLVSWPGWAAQPALLVVAGACGAALAVLAGVLRLRFGAHEVIATLVLNRVAESWVAYMLSHGAALGGTVRTPSLPEAARLPMLGDWIQRVHGSALSVALLLALAVVFLVALFLRNTALGRELVLCGQGPTVAALHGVPVMRRALLAFAVSGALAGLTASATVQGYKGYYEQGLGAGFGFSGMAVALVGAGRPWAMVAMAVLVATLEQGGLFANAYVPRELMTVVVGIVLLVSASRRPTGDQYA